VRAARRLVLASGTQGEQIDVWAASDLPGIPRQLPAYVAEVLRSLGYKTRLRLVPFATFSPTMRSGMQVSVDGDWVPDYPAPTAFMPSFFGCHGGDNRKHYVCDPELDRQMRSASALQLRDATRAAALWAKIDHQLVDQAVWVPLVNTRAIEFVSKRLRNYQYHPVWGFMADQAWVR
jgi:peptide/nickel transport system substrate-binding protein